MRYAILLRLPTGKEKEKKKVVSLQADWEIIQGQLLQDEACVAKETIC